MTVLGREGLLDLLVRAAAIGYDQAGASCGSVDTPREIVDRLGPEVDEILPTGDPAHLLVSTAHLAAVPWDALDDAVLIEIRDHADDVLTDRSQAGLIARAVAAVADSTELQQLVDEHGPVLHLTFGTTESTNGWWFGSGAGVVFADGAEEDVELWELEDDLTEIAGTVQPLTHRAEARIHLAAHDGISPCASLPALEICECGIRRLGGDRAH